VRHREIKPETGQRIVERIKQGKLSLIALHSAHWSTPFIEAMNERALADALATLTPEERKTAKTEVIRPEKYGRPRAAMTRSLLRSIVAAKADGTLVLKINLPNCCFPGVSAPTASRATCGCCCPSHPHRQRAAPMNSTSRTPKCTTNRFTCRARTRSFSKSAGTPANASAAARCGGWETDGCFYFRPGHETFEVLQTARSYADHRERGPAGLAATQSTSP